MNISVDNFVSKKNNTLQGFFTVYFNDLGISMQGFSLHVKAEAKWIEFPAKRPPTSGNNEKWTKVFEFYDKRKEKEFIACIMKELKILFEDNPHLLEG